MPEANYQDVIRNPYSLQNNEPGRDHGLWDVLGRAIRSTVPTRANTTFDPNAPVTDTNAPYQKPGFFRALAGDRGADMNRAAMMQGADVGLSKGLAGEQALYHSKEQAEDFKNRMAQATGVYGLQQNIQNLRDKAAMERAQLLGKGRMDAVNAQGANSYMNTLERNRGMADVAKQTAAGRMAAAQTNRQLDPSMVELNRARAAQLNAGTAQKQALADRLKQAGQESTSGGMGLGDMIKNWFGGNNNTQPPAGIVRPPVSTGNPQTIGIPGTGPSPIGTAPGMPSTIKIDPMDLKALGIGVGSGLTQERNNGMQGQQSTDDMDDNDPNDLDDILPMYGNGY